MPQRWACVDPSDQHARNGREHPDGPQHEPGPEDDAPVIAIGAVALGDHPGRIGEKVHARPEEPSWNRSEPLSEAPCRIMRAFTVIVTMLTARMAANIVWVHNSSRRTATQAKTSMLDSTASAKVTPLWAAAVPKAAAKIVIPGVAEADTGAKPHPSSVKRMSAGAPGIAFDRRISVRRRRSRSR